MPLTSITDIITEVLVRGQQNTASGFITDEMLNDWLTEKHRWAAGYKPWPYVEGRASTTYASLITDEDGDLRGEYFENWKPDSIRFMWIGGDRIKKLNFQDYMKFREDTSSSQDKVFTDFGLIYKLNPNADVSGTITAWGRYIPYIDVTDNTANTVFSNRNENGNEAIVEAVIGALKQRSNNPQEANIHYAKATALLNEMWEEIRGEQHAYHGGDTGIFEHFSVLNGGFVDDLNNPLQWR